MELVVQLQDDEIFEDMKNSILKINTKKFFLDDLRIAVSTDDLQAFM